ncbi:MAG TPA: DinB family protein [Anaerolineales bacterium]|nr:DinB family protein [Anaerolineales bacterium]
MNAAQFFDHWEIVHRDLLRGVSMLKDEDLAFRPAAAYPRTVGGILRHIANLQDGWIQFVVRRQVEAWPAEGDPSGPSVAAVRADLERAHRETMGYLATIPVEDLNRLIQVPDDGTPKLGWILWHVFEQVIHHRGELFLCLSLLGMERPAIDRPS